MSQAQYAEHLATIHAALDRDNGGGRSRITIDPPRGTWDPEKGVWCYGLELEVADPAAVPYDAITPPPAEAPPELGIVSEPDPRPLSTLHLVLLGAWLTTCALGGVAFTTWVSW